MSKRSAETTDEGPRKQLKTAEDLNLDNPQEFLEMYQKEAIWRQLQKYKRDSQDAMDQLGPAQESTAKFQASLQHASKLFAKIQDDLRAFIISISSSIPPARSDLSKFWSTILDPRTDSKHADEALASAATSVHKLLVEIGSVVRACSEHNNTLETKLKQIVDHDPELRRDSVISGLRDQVDLLLKEKEQHSSKLENLQTELHTLSQSSRGTESENARLKSQIAQTSNRLEETKHQLSVTQKKLDRAVCLTTNTATTTPTETKSDPMEIVPKVEENGQTSEQVEHLTRELEVQRTLAEQRLSNIQKLEQERASLREEAEQLRVKAESADTNGDAPSVRQLQQQCSMFKAEAESLRTQLDRAIRDVEELRANARKVREQVEAEEVARRKTLEAELRKLDADLNRIRGARDQLQQALDLRMSKDQTEIIQNHEIRVIANTRKDRIVVLETEIQRLRMKLTAEKGDAEGFELHNHYPDEALIEELRKRLETAEDTLKTSRLAENHEELLNLQKELEELRKKVADHEAIFTGKENLAELGSKLKESEAKVKDLELQLERHQKMEAKLLSEVEQIGQAWTHLEDQNSRKVLDLTTKEDLIQQLLAEKTKLDQKCSVLTKQSNTFNNMAMALKKQSDKQLEQIRRLEEYDRMLQDTIANNEKELAARQAVSEAHKKKAVELNNVCTELRERLDTEKAKTSNRAQDNSLRLSKVDDLERSNRELKEENAMLQSRLSKVSKSDGGADSSELAEYKLLVKCPSCNFRLKNTLLLRCMHTFCENCVSDLLESRQRKCPTCGLGFGQSDVKEFYL